jgi:hypothetical protein
LDHASCCTKKNIKLLKILKNLFLVINLVGYGGNTILYIKTCWDILSEKWIQLLNPFLHTYILVVLTKTPLFWLFLLFAIAGIYCAQLVDKKIEIIRDRESNGY